MQARYYDRDGNPVSQERWQQLGRQPGYSRVGYVDVTRHGRQVTVVTFWSGIAASDDLVVPLIFCTCAGIRSPAARRAAYQRLWSWPTIQAARTGHQTVTTWIAEVADFLAGATSQLPRRTRPCPARPPPQAGKRRAGHGRRHAGPASPAVLIITVVRQVSVTRSATSMRTRSFA